MPTSVAPAPRRPGLVAGRRGCRDHTATRRARAASIRIHGRGPLSDLLASALRCSGARITHSSRTHAGAPSEPTDLAVLSDFLVSDPRVVRDLHAARGAAPSGAGTRRCRPGRAAGHSRRDELPGMRRSASQRPRRRLAGGRSAAARHRRQRRPGDRAGDRGAGAQPGRPRRSARSAAATTSPTPPAPPPRWTPRWSSTSTRARSWRAAGHGTRAAPADNAS